MPSGSTAVPTGGVVAKPPPGFSPAVIEYRLARPVRIPAGGLIVHWKDRAVAFQRQNTVTAAMCGPLRVARTRWSAASADARRLAIVWPAALVSRNLTVIAADLLWVLPRAGEVNPPKPYSTM